MNRRIGSAAPALVAGACGVLSLVALGLAAANGEDADAFLAGNQANTWLAGLAFGVAGALVLGSRPGNRLGPIYAAAGLLAATGSAAAEYTTYTLYTRPGALPARDFVAWCGTTLWLPAFLMILVAVPLLFPDGRLASPRWRVPAGVAAVAGGIAVLSLATTEYIVDDGYPAATNPFDLPVPDGPQVTIGLVGFVVTVAVGVAAMIAILLRMRRLGQPQRSQHAWYVGGVMLALAAAELPVPDEVSFVMNALTVTALGVAVVRYQLFDIEVVLSRALVYTLLTAGAVAAYLAAAAVLGASLTARADIWPALVAAVVAMVLGSARHRVQRVVDRLLYGDRSDPLAALTELGENLGRALHTDAVLPAVVEAVRATLRLPYAAVQLAGESGPACESGERPARTAEFPLAHAGENVGALVVGLRRGEPALASADGDLLAAVARQAGVAAHDVRVTRELRRSRERLVVAREEERRRLRRNLHDGLGPALAGITLGLETAQRTAGRENSAVTELLGQLHDESAACVEEIRRISADLRPATLDQIGLVPALRQHADLITSRSAGELVVEVTEAAPLPALPAAAEAAAYRIALEAITNTTRHAAARSCRVSIELNGSLFVTITDDGNGSPASGPGVGLRSMLERAEELGGTCMVVFREGEGTLVHAELPVGAA